MKIGDRINIRNGGGEYIVAQCSYNKAVLIHLASGDRWTNAVEIEDMNQFSNDEIGKLIYDGSFDWEILDKVSDSKG